MRVRPRPDLIGPRGFRGRLDTDTATRNQHASARGPFRIQPRAVARPRDAEDLSTLLGWCRAENVAVVPRAAATGMPGGNVGPGLVIDVSPLDAIGPVDPERRTIRVGAGAIAAHVDQAAQAAGLRFPPLPSSAAWCTIGGMIANNAAGARSFSMGATRAWVDSVEAVLDDGSIVELGAGEPSDPLARRLPALTPGAAWPEVLKNSSGYALDAYARSGGALDLILGSEGTLAIVTAATLRLVPISESCALAAVPCRSTDELLEWCEWARSAHAATCEMLGRRLLEMIRLGDDPHLSFLGPDLEAVLLLEWEGTAVAVDRAIGLLADAARTKGVPVAMATDPRDRSDLWELRHRASPLIAQAAERGLRSLQFIEDSVVPPHALEQYLVGVRHILTEAETDAVLFGHAGDAHIHVNPLVDLTRPSWPETVRRILDSVADLVAALGGTLSGEHGDGRVRAPYLEKIWGLARTQRFRALKWAFDPHGILNPGVIVPLPGQDPLEGLAP